MIRLIVQLARLLGSASYWDRAEKTLRALFFLFTNILLFVTLCCWLPSGWNVIDSFYFCIITLATVIYGGVAPTLSLTKILVAFLALLGTGALVLVAGKLGNVVSNHKCSRD